MDEKFVKYQGLIELTKTTEDIVDMSDEISALMYGLYHTELYKFEKVLEQSVRLRVASEIRRLLKSYELTGKDEIKQFLSQGYKTICALPILRLTLAFEPSETAINDISDWARNNIEERIILDLTLDRRLLGGALIEYKGKYYDYSLKTKLEEIFAREDLTL